jgi:hypothetical protein
MGGFDIFGIIFIKMSTNEDLKAWKKKRKKKQRTPIWKDCKDDESKKGKSIFWAGESFVPQGAL